MSCQISKTIVTQQVGKCHCSLQRLEEGCHILYRSLFVWFILTGPIHHCWACWLSLQLNHRKHRNFFHGINAHTLPPFCSGLLVFSLCRRALSFSSCSSLLIFLLPSFSVALLLCSSLCVDFLVYPYSTVIPTFYTNASSRHVNNGRIQC